MKQGCPVFDCRRCHYPKLDVIRESTVVRRNREYEICWYSCPRCGDIRFSYRRHDLGTTSPMIVAVDREHVLSHWGPAHPPRLPDSLPRCSSGPGSLHAHSALTRRSATSLFLAIIWHHDMPGGLPRHTHKRIVLSTIQQSSILASISLLGTRFCRTRPAGMLHARRRPWPSHGKFAADHLKNLRMSVRGLRNTILRLIVVPVSRPLAAPGFRIVPRSRSTAAGMQMPRFQRRRGKVRMEVTAAL